MTQIQKEMQKLIKIFEQTAGDNQFSRAEKKSVMQILKENETLKKSQRDYLRHKIFEIARNKTQEYKSQLIIDWLESASKLLQDAYDADNEVYFSPGDQCKKAIINQLKNALSKIDICVYTLSDNLIAEEIIKCQQRKLNIRIITDNEKINDTGSDIKHLAQSGIDVRIDNSPHYMHHKFAIFDQKKIITGSYNWTRSAADYNQENIIVTDQQHVVHEYISEFEKLWNQSVPLKKD